MATALPALAKLGIGVGGSILGKLFGGNSDLQNIEKAQVANAQETGERSRTRFAESENALAPAFNFNTRLLSGDPATARSAIGPEVNSILGQYDTARQAVAQNVGRGGGATRTLAGLPFEAAGKITNTLNTSRRGAADSLAQLFSALTGSSENLSSLSSSSLTSAAETNLGRTEQQYKRGQDFGKAFGSIFGKVLFPDKKAPTSPGADNGQG